MLGSFQIFLNILEDICKSRCATGINGTSGKFAAGINDTGGKFSTGTASVTTPVANCHLNDTGGK
jgi:hypothetical protein